MPGKACAAVELTAPWQIVAVRPHPTRRGDCNRSRASMRRQQRPEGNVRFLVLEDEPELARHISKLLKNWLGVVDSFAYLAEATEALAMFDYDLLIVDRRVPDGDGVTLLQSLRQIPAPPGVIMLTALDSTQDIVDALQAGADDYLAKPFEPAELLARVHAILRRPRVTATQTAEIGNLTLELGTATIRVDGREAQLRRQEAQVLECLILRKNRVVTRDSLM
ncbi:response regulator transcription factor, partial [Thioclava sp. BHET1]